MIYLSPVPWASFSQRPHHFVNWLHSQTEAPVLWVDPYPTRLPSLQDFTRTSPAGQQQRVAIPHWLQLCKPQALPIEPIAGSGLLQRWLWRDIFKQAMAFAEAGHCMICVGKPTELALQLLALLPACYSVYDAMDDFPAFYRGLSRRSMESRQRRLVSKVSKVLAASTTLRDKLLSATDEVELVLNACDIQAFAPVDSLDLGQKQHILGYVGTIGRWFDWDLVVAMARANPVNRIQLIGPISTPAPCPLPSNIELLPECSHAEAISAMARFSVGLIPFKLSRLTASVDPIKYYEYRALGLPVISTRFGEMARRGEELEVWIVDHQSELHNVCQSALAFQSNHLIIRQFRRDNLWSMRFAATQVHTHAYAAFTASGLSS
ncbi:glycosyl transferase [Pseudomonas sp. FEN]|uniref:glycosyl transferase n=1 Tax=Pseudomonas sp. FEN TaxID=2767468 RepID=UPI0019AB4438|nr:glycosyl transferase [Pseudomonas sp. FEN]CAD5202895.1 Putative glycosyltransferase [Pseudomonas sp. FEN]